MSTEAPPVRSEPKAAAAAGHPLAIDAAREVINRGGNAADAAIAASAVQCVAELPWCGVAGDTFLALRTSDGEIHTINGSGAAPLSIEAVVPPGTKVPRFGSRSVGTPGLVAAWDTLHRRFATLPFDHLMSYAVEAAREGIVVDERLSAAITNVLTGGDSGNLADLFPSTQLMPGDTLRLPELADTLEQIGSHGAAVFYEGPIAHAIDAAVRDAGGALSLDDLRAHQSRWSTPLSVRYRTALVHTQAPVSMGSLLLLQLKLLEHFNIADSSNADPEIIDLLVRCKHAAFEHGFGILGDPDHVAMPLDDLFDSDFTAELAAQIHLQRGVAPPPSNPDDLMPSGDDTTSLAIVDEEGMTVSLVQSLFNEFGARVLVPGTGLILNDRLANLAVNPDHPNGLKGGKRPVHTLHSFIAESDDGSFVAGGTPGGRGQVQTNLQVLVDVLDHGTGIQEALDLPRWVSGTPRRSPPDDVLYLEPTHPDSTVERLRELGHDVHRRTEARDDHFGCCTVVARQADGTPTTGEDHRRGSVASTW